MLILTIRTDKPEAELGLYQDDQLLDGFGWQAHRELAETIHVQISNLLKSHNKTFSNVEGIVVYKGPGSFTGLRIGIATANAVADSLGAPIVGTGSDEWQLNGVKMLLTGKNDKQVVPDYGAEAHITTPKH